MRADRIALGSRPLTGSGWAPLGGAWGEAVGGNIDSIS